MLAFYFRRNQKRGLSALWGFPEQRPGLVPSPKELHKRIWFLSASRFGLAVRPRQLVQFAVRCHNGIMRWGSRGSRSRRPHGTSGKGLASCTQYTRILPLRRCKITLNFLIVVEHRGGGSAKDKDPTQACKPEMRRISTSAPISISISLPRISPLGMRRIFIYQVGSETRNGTAPRFFHDGPCQPYRRPSRAVAKAHIELLGNSQGRNFAEPLTLE